MTRLLLLLLLLLLSCCYYVARPHTHARHPCAQARVADLVRKRQGAGAVPLLLLGPGLNADPEGTPPAAAAAPSSGTAASRGGGGGGAARRVLGDNKSAAVLGAGAGAGVGVGVGAGVGAAGQVGVGVSGADGAGQASGADGSACGGPLEGEEVRQGRVSRSATGGGPRAGNLAVWGG